MNSRDMIEELANRYRDTDGPAVTLYVHHDGAADYFHAMRLVGGVARWCLFAQESTERLEILTT